MKYPKAYAMLGHCVELVLTHEGYDYTHTWPVSGQNRRLLLAGENGKSLLLVKPRKQRAAKDNDFARNQDKLNKAIDVFESFADKLAIKINRMNIPNYKLKRFGRVKHIIYHSEKWGKKQAYIHEFKNPTYAAINYTSNGKNPPILLVTGNKLKITRRGIEG